MEEGSVLTGAGNGKASDSRPFVVEIEMDKKPEHYGDGASEKLMEASTSGATRIVEKGSCRSWVVEMETMLEDANPEVERVQWSRHSIYRVPQFIKDTTNSEAYSPRFVARGPLHHGEPHLLPMEEHNRRAVLHMVNRSGKPLQDFLAAIDAVADELQAAYNDLDDDKWRGANKGRFVELMVMDGCCLLEWIRAENLGRQGVVDKDYATNDPIFSSRSTRNLWAITRIDMICMENQIPLVVLQKLLAVQRGTSVKAKEINSMVVRHLDGPYFRNGMDELGLHFLDIYHKSYSGTCQQWEGSVKYEPRTPCAIELNEAGIKFRKSNTKNIHDVDFKNGVLSMPVFKVAAQTEARLLNLMAFEWLHPDANSFVSSYISFLDALVMSERDVALLRSEGLLLNLRSDKKIVDMFNTFKTKSAMRGSKLGHVMWEVKQHCKKRRNKWRAIFINTYLSNPWVIASMLAAFILLVAAVMQTVYTVVPFYTRKG